MERREFVKLGAAASIPVSGCIDGTSTGSGRGGGSSDSDEAEVDLGDIPEHGKWLYDPDDVDVGSDHDWFGYIYTVPEEIPGSHPWSGLYDGYGIEMNLKHYSLDTSMMDSTYSGVDVTRYSNETDLMEASPDEDIGVSDLEAGREILMDRPASTGGPLDEQEIVDRIDGFDVYERGAAVDKDRKLLISSIQEYIRKDVVPAILETDETGLVGEFWDDYYSIINHLELGQYVEIGLNPTELPTYPNFHTDERTAFGRSNEIVSEDEVHVTQVEVFSEEDSLDDEYMLSHLQRDEVDEARQEGRFMIYETVTDEVVTAFMD